jgi:glucose-1-phosphate adenylyltransferase
MGIYMFGARPARAHGQRPKLVDFGRHIIPKLVPEARVHAYVYRGYWEDVGTIQSYFDANLALCQPVPPFDFYDTARPVFSNPRFLPATKIEGARSRTRSSPKAPSSCRPRSGTRSSASAPASAAGCASRTA